MLTFFGRGFQEPPARDRTGPEANMPGYHAEISGLGPSRQGALSGRDFSCATDDDALAEAKLAEVVRKGGSLSGNALRGLVLVPVKQSQTR